MCSNLLKNFNFDFTFITQEHFKNENNHFGFCFDLSVFLNKLTFVITL